MAEELRTFQLDGRVQTNPFAWQGHVKTFAPLGLRAQTVFMLKFQELIQPSTNSGNQFFDVGRFSVINSHCSPSSTNV